jgi:5-methylcytosine-specific restriction endonuclease McrA
MMITRLNGARPGGRKELRSHSRLGRKSGVTKNYRERIDRPAWKPGTRQKVLNLASPKQVGGETHYKCAKGECPKGQTYHPASNTQVDHIKPWEKYIDSKVDDISDKAAVKEAYNDPSNLQALCKTCNAKKGNREGAALAKQFRKKKKK